MKLFFACFLVSFWSLTIEKKISTDYMDKWCGYILFMVDSWSSIRVKLTDGTRYSSRMNCDLSVNTTSLYKLMFYFDDMDIECNGDWLQVHDGTTTHAPIVPGLPGKLCGPNGPSGSYHTTANMLTLFFVSDSAWGGKGFDMVITRYHTGSCYTDEYRCSNGRCIDGNLTCNGLNPCGDNSDCRLSAGAIAGIVIGSIVGLWFCTCVILLNIYRIRRCRRERRAQSEFVTIFTTSSATPDYNQPVPQEYPTPTDHPTENQPPAPDSN